jgi:hypothetical protein
MQERNPIREDIHNHPTNPIVEVHGRHVSDLGVVVTHRVLEGFVEEEPVLVDGGHDVDVVVGDPAVAGALGEGADF